MSNGITRRHFIKRNARLGLTFSLMANPVVSAFSNNLSTGKAKAGIPIIKKGERQIFADDIFIASKTNVLRKCHTAKKLKNAVIEGDREWEYVDNENVKIPYAGIYGTVLRDEITGSFRMWYNVNRKTCYAESQDGINWEKPVLGQLGATNMINLFDFHSPSIILDKREPDPAKRYKVIGSKDGFSKEVIDKLKSKFRNSESYHRKFAYCAAYSPDGLNWKMYPDPVLLGMDTITLAQDPLSGEYLAFHKQTQDPRSIGRQIFLSTSKDMMTWSDTELVMATDETDHEQARKLENGTHSEFYNMSAFYNSSQWLGLVTHFRCTGEPLVDGKAKAGQKGIIDVQLVHSRDGRYWQRCSDRSPVIPAGPYAYDSGMVFGVCNTPVTVGDEMWMYYAASTDIHGGTSTHKKVSIALAKWRLDGMVSLNAGNAEGFVETVLFKQQGGGLFVNTCVSAGQLIVEVLDDQGKVIPGYSKAAFIPLKGSGIRQLAKWRGRSYLPENRLIRLRFYITNGDLYSFTIE